MGRSTIRIAAIIEASTVTGPAKNLLRFAALARTPPAGEPVVDLSIVTFQRGAGGQANPFLEAARGSGISVDVISERAAFDFRVLRSLTTSLERLAPDIVQTHAVKSHFLMRSSRLYRKYPWIAFHHGYTSVDLKMLAYNQLDRWSLGASRRLITVCKPFAAEVEKIGVARSKIEILPNSIEPTFAAAPEAVTEARRRLGIGPDGHVLLSIGRLSREKGHVDLVAAVAQMERSRPDVPWCIVLAGEGPERQNIERAAAGLRSRFVLTGHLGDVKPLFGLADAFVLPSLSEGSPNVLLEAMAAGVPIVATEVGGVPETIRDEFSGLLIPPRRPELMATKILRIFDEPGLARALRENASRELSSRSPEAYRRALVKIYSSLIEAPPK